jgi:peptide/nickel transport system permease protein
MPIPSSLARGAVPEKALDRFVSVDTLSRNEPVGRSYTALTGDEPGLPAETGAHPVTAVGASWVRMRPTFSRHPVLTLVARRAALGVGTLFVVSIVVFAATQVLPGNAAYAVLGHNVSPLRVHALEAQLHLNRSAPSQYLSWLGGVLSGSFGHSLASGGSVWRATSSRLLNSAVLVAIVGVISSMLGIGLGVLAARRKDTAVDHVLSVAFLTVTALPEFIVGIALIMLFSTLALHWLPGVSDLAPGTRPWNQPKLLILPVVTLILVTVPYIYRMMRAAMIEALESDYVEMATLKGLSVRRIAFVHALPSALAPTIQVIGITFLYLAGGVVLVEYVFAYPGIGQGLVNAVDARDIPVIQFIVLTLAAFYVAMNIATDVIALLVSPRRRVSR